MFSQLQKQQYSLKNLIHFLRYQSLGSLEFIRRTHLHLFAILKSTLRCISLLFFNPHPDACVVQNLLKPRYFLLEVEHNWPSSLLKTRKGSILGRQQSDSNQT